MADAAKAGININLNIKTQTLYYGKATFGNSDWLDGTMSLVDYGDRGVPNVFLAAPLPVERDVERGPLQEPAVRQPRRSSTWPRSISRPRRSIAGKIENLLLAETPIVYPYWIDGLTASTQSVGGLNPTSIAQIYLNTAYKTA